MNIDLKGKTALICGATKGIGRAIAQSFAESGAQIVALARNENELKELVKNLPNTGHSYLCVDLSQHQELSNKVTTLLQTKSIDILINNSAGPKPGPVTEANEEDFMAAFNQHILAAQVITKVLLPSMKKKKFGRIINIVSTSVRCPIPGLGVSNTIRGAMASWSKTLATEVASSGITVNCILPGYTMTERLKQLIEYKAKLNNHSYQNEENNWRSEVPAGRFAEPKEIASFAHYLCSDLAGYITGTAIPVDGGKTPSL